MRKLIKAGIAAALMATSLVAVAPAQATTDHCDSSTYPNKVDIGGGSTVYTGLQPGTTVCIKVATRIDIVFVDYNGYITNTTILNTNGKAQGISYYAYGDENPS